MSETQAKGKKLDMRISRKTINAIHQSKTANGNLGSFQENQVVESPTPAKKSLSLKISRKKDAPRRTIGLAIDADTQSSESNLVDELLADLAINTESTDGAVSEPSSNTSDIFAKLDNLDNDDFSISNNDIPVDFDAIDKVYGTNNISEIQTIKRDNAPKRTVKSARRGIVKAQKIEEKPDEEKPYYMVVDTDINYDEILSRPNKKASEMIDQNSPFFYTPNVFTSEDIKYSDVDLAENYGGEFLLEDYIAPDNGIKHSFIGGSDDEDYFKRPKPKDYYSRRNTYIIESHEADDSAFDIIERINKYDLDIVDRIDDLEADESVTSTSEENANEDNNSAENTSVEANVGEETPSAAPTNDIEAESKADEPKVDDTTDISAETENASQEQPETTEVSKKDEDATSGTNDVIPEEESTTADSNQELDNVDDLVADELLAEILASDNNDDLSEITKMIDNSSKGGFESKIFGNNSADEDDSDFINTIDNLEDLEDLEDLNKIENINDLDTLDHLDDVQTSEDEVSENQVMETIEATETSDQVNSLGQEYNEPEQINERSFEVAAENSFNFEPASAPVQKPKARKSKFSNSIFKTFTFDDSSELLTKEEIAAVQPVIDESIHESFLDKAAEVNVNPTNVQASAPTSIQKPVIDSSIPVMDTNSVANKEHVIEAPIKSVNTPTEEIETPIQAEEPIIHNIVESAKSAKNNVVKQSKDAELDEKSLYDLDLNKEENNLIQDEDDLEMVLRTSTTFMENDYDDYGINDTFDDDSLNDDYSLDDNSEIDFDDTDSYGYTEDGFKRLIPPDEDEIKDKDVSANNSSKDSTKKEKNKATQKSKETLDVDNDEKHEATDITDVSDLNVDDINLDDISLDDIDLNEIDLTNDDFLKDLATPSSEEITEKLTNEFSSLDQELKDILLSEVMDEDENKSNKDDQKNDQKDDSDDKLEDNEFYKLINSLSNTITNLENSISMPDPVQEPVKEKDEKKKSGKAINILINKDDIFSISIENETYDIVADFRDISVVSQNINISTPKNNFFTKIGNKYIEIHRKEDASFVVYTNFEDIEFENAINNINFAKKKDKIELNIKESFKLASIDNKVSLSILNSNVAKIKRPGSTDDNEPEDDKSGSVCDNDVLTINEETQKVYLPYKIEDVMNMIKNPANGYHTIKEVVEGEYTIPMSTFKPPIVSRFKEAYNFMRTKENSSVYAALDLALELMFNANLNPAIIRACNNLRELNVYLDCLYENELEKFDCFKIVYKVLPRIQ